MSTAETQPWFSHSRAQMLPQQRYTATQPPNEDMKVVQESVEKAKQEYEVAEPNTLPAAEPDPLPAAEPNPPPTEERQSEA